MQQNFLVTGRVLEPLPPKPVLSDFYVPSEDHHNRKLAFIMVSMICYISIYIGNNFEDRLKALEMENASLKNIMITIKQFVKLIIRLTCMSTVVLISNQ